MWSITFLIAYMKFSILAQVWIRKSLCFFDSRILFALVYNVKLTEQKVIDVGRAS